MIRSAFDRSTQWKAKIPISDSKKRQIKKWRLLKWTKNQKNVIFFLNFRKQSIFCAKWRLFFLVSLRSMIYWFFVTFRVNEELTTIQCCIIICKIGIGAFFCLEMLHFWAFLCKKSDFFYKNGAKSILWSKDPFSIIYLL